MFGSSLATFLGLGIAAIVNMAGGRPIDPNAASVMWPLGSAAAAATGIYVWQGVQRTGWGMRPAAGVLWRVVGRLAGLAAAADDRPRSPALAGAPLARRGALAALSAGPDLRRPFRPRRRQVGKFVRKRGAPVRSAERRGARPACPPGRDRPLWHTLEKIDHANQQV